MTSLSLDEWLDANCRYLEKEIETVPNKGDLPPLFAGLKDGAPIVFNFDFTSIDKGLAIDLFRAGLQGAGAEQYVIIMAAWYVSVPREDTAALRLIDREGTGGVYKDQRRECYQVTVGDRERSLIAFYEVERDYKGKIRRLIQKTKGAPDVMFGRFCDLLVERTQH